MTTGQKIKQIRQHLGYTQREMAAWLETSQPSLSAIERDKRKVSRSLQLLATALYAEMEMGRLSDTIIKHPPWVK